MVYGRLHSRSTWMGRSSGRRDGAGRVISWQFVGRVREIVRPMMNKIKRTTECTDAQRLALEWLARHGDMLYAFAFRRVGDPHVAEDLVQETFLAAIRSVAGFRRESGEQTWLTAILKRKIADYFQTRSKSVKTLGNADQEALSAPFNKRGKLVGIGRWPAFGDSEVERAEFQEAFRSCLNKLPAHLAGAFVLRVMDEETTEDACNILGITPTNLSVRLHRARLALRQCLEQWF